ncbi:deoxyribonuclease IV [Paenibacillus wynnii]|uniref:Endonuclease IV n=1 Tax=Paenibacillus wynnii TaxID=268407 RepID=A0A098M449_9BACL|nr:deoxyribonuclease IV [Paenibacillus wynnii]KGE17329.1 endonuclease IV [Paenibacillus wynnii]
MNSKPAIGSHVSIRGGFGKAARFAWESGATGFQYFPKNPRSLKIKPVNRRDAEDCAVFCREKGLKSIAHTPYPTNMGANSNGRSITVLSLRNDLEIAEACGSLGIVVHFGHFQGTEPLQGYQNIIQCMNETLDSWEGRAKLLIENQAGTSGSTGTTLEELVKVRELSRYPEKIGFCFDTCHAFAAGIWNPSDTGELIKRGQALGYWDDLEAVHLNDSLHPFASGRDRHAVIGKGYIGNEGLRSLLTAEQLCPEIMVMETETGADGTYRNEMDTVNSWY